MPSLTIIDRAEFRIDWLRRNPHAGISLGVVIYSGAVRLRGLCRCVNKEHFGVHGGRSSLALRRKSIR